MGSLGLLLGAGTAMAATCLGASGVFVTRKVPQSVLPVLIAFSAGMMALSALEMANESHALCGHARALMSMVIGMIVLGLLAKVLPHAHLFLAKSEMPPAKLKVAILAGAITLHNIPEGIAIASAFSDSPGLGWLVTMSIALQDIPEGLIVSMPVAFYGTTALRSFGWGAFSGVVEFAAAVAGYYFLTSLSTMVPYALGFSAGAMLYVVLFELLPDAMHGGARHKGTLAFLAGIATAYLLSTVFAT